MKSFLRLSLLACLAVAPAYAAKNSEVVNFATPVKVGSTQFAPGSVTVTWTGTGSNAQLTLVQKGVSPITVPAKLVEEKHERPTVTTDSRTGVAVLETIELKHIKLSVESATSSGQ
jgi:hypothetical protein